MKQSIYKGRVLELSLETVTLPNGAQTQLELITHPGAAAVVPLQEDGTVIMIQQYRHAVGGFIYEIPAGKLHPGEDPQVCAARELEEEIGYQAAELRHLLSFFTTPGFTNEIIHIYLGTTLKPGRQHLGSDEVLQVVRFPLEQTIALINNGTIRDGKTIIGLQATYLRLPKL
ncbi:MAG: NUDIX hydrolase [Nitrospirae bacterium]|nr:MAG: NUDIX hydrolase [Nitrospirota bacterium]